MLQNNNYNTAAAAAMVAVIVIAMVVVIVVEVVMVVILVLVLYCVSKKPDPENRLTQLHQNKPVMNDFSQNASAINCGLLDMG